MRASRSSRRSLKPNVVYSRNICPFPLLCGVFVQRTPISIELPGRPGLCVYRCTPIGLSKGAHVTWTLTTPLCLFLRLLILLYNVFSGVYTHSFCAFEIQHASRYMYNVLLVLQQQLPFSCSRLPCCPDVLIPLSQSMFVIYW